MSELAAERRIARGNRLQRGADLLCHARRVGAGVIGVFNLASSAPRSWGATAAVAATYATDKLDGMFARQASVDLERPPTDAGKTLDQKVDKHAHDMLAVSHIFTAWQRRQRVFAGVMAISLGAQVWRDSVVNRERQRAQDVAADTDVPIHVGSVPSSKIKMGLVATADIGTQSPIADTEAGRFGLGVTHLAATALSLISGGRIIRGLHEGISTALEAPAD